LNSIRNNVNGIIMILTPQQITDTHTTLQGFLSRLTQPISQRDVETILINTHTIFKTIKKCDFSLVLTELKLCTLIAVNCSKCIHQKRHYNHGLYQHIANITEFYLDSTPSDVELIQQCCEIRDDVLKKNPDDSMPDSETVSDIFDKFTLPEITDLDPSEQNTNLTLAHLDFLQNKTNNTISLDDLTRRFDKIKHDIKRNKKIATYLIKRFTYDMLQSIHAQKKDNPYKTLFNVPSDHSIIKILEFAIDVQNTLINYYKTKDKDIFQLHSALRFNAFYTDTLSIYYNRTNATEELKREKKYNAASARIYYLNIKGVRLCDYVIQSSETSDDEKQRAKDKKRALLTLTEPTLERISTNDTNEPWNIVESYQQLEQEFNLILNNHLPIPFSELLHKITIHLEQAVNLFFQQEDKIINILHIDEEGFYDELDVSNSPGLAPFSRERLTVFQMISLFYNAKKADLNQSRYGLIPGGPEDQGVLIECFRIEAKLGFYSYLLNPSMNIPLHEHQYNCRWIANNPEYQSPLLKAIAINEYKIATDTLSSMVQEQEITQNASSVPTAPVLTKNNKQSSNKARRKRKELNSNLIEDQWKALQTTYLQKGLRSQDWIEISADIIGFYNKGEYDDALSLIKNIIEDFTTQLSEHDAEEQKILIKNGIFDALIWKSTILKAQCLYDDSLKCLIKAWDYITPIEACKNTHHAQTQKITLERARVFTAKGDVERAAIAFSCVKEIASNNDTFCFGLLLDELNNLTDDSLAREHYQEPLERLINNSKPLLIDPYNISDFFDFYLKLSSHYHELGLKDNLIKKKQGRQNARKEGTLYFADNIRILNTLLSYAQTYSPTRVLDIQMVLINAYKESYKIDHRHSYHQESKRVYTDALNAANSTGNSKLIARVKSLDWSAKEIIDSRDQLQLEAAVKEKSDDILHKHGLEMPDPESPFFSDKQFDDMNEKMIKLQKASRVLAGELAGIKEKCKPLFFEAEVSETLHLSDNVDTSNIKIKTPDDDSVAIEKTILNAIQKKILLDELVTIIIILSACYDRHLGTTEGRQLTALIYMKISDLCMIEETIIENQLKILCPNDDNQPSTNTPPDKLIHLYNAQQHQLAQLLHEKTTQKRKLDKSVLNRTSNTETSENAIAIRIKWKITTTNDLLKEIKTYPDSNTNESKIKNISACHALNIANPTLSGLKTELVSLGANASDCIWEHLHHALIQIVQLKKNKSRHTDGNYHFIVGRIMHWTLNYIKDNIHPVIDTEDEHRSFKAFFDMIKNLCKDRYQKSNSVFPSDDRVRVLKDELKQMTLPDMTIGHDQYLKQEMGTSKRL
jgi:hypothetical protein